MLVELSEIEYWLEISNFFGMVKCQLVNPSSVASSIAFLDMRATISCSIAVFSFDVLG